jgi:predicted nucleotidyltransferase
MDTAALPQDFKDFLKLLNTKQVEYLLVGGYAVGYHGYPRATADIDFWIRLSQDNATKMMQVLTAFGFGGAGCSEELFMQEGNVVRMGHPPIRIEVINAASGVDFESCYHNRMKVTIDGIQVDLINLQDLKSNKKASGRSKDLADLDNLP